LLWELIDDDQTPDWTGIPATVTINDVATFGGMVFGDVSIAGQFNETWAPDRSGWTQINDSQTVTWTQINDNQTTGWTQIDDTQTVTWTEVVQ
jgi:hypothetical protein